MNKTSRAALSALQVKLAALVSELEAMHEDANQLAEDEQEKFDNMTEGLQQGEKGQAIEQAANNLADLASAIESIKDSLEEAANAEVE